MWGAGSVKSAVRNLLLMRLSAAVDLRPQICPYTNTQLNSMLQSMCALP